MSFFDKQKNDVRENYNYFFLKLINLISKDIFKLSSILFLCCIFNYTISNIIGIMCIIYYFYNIISISKHYADIIKDVKKVLGYGCFYFKINFGLLNNNIFKGDVKYGR